MRGLVIVRSWKCSPFILIQYRRNVIGFLFYFYELPSWATKPGLDKKIMTKQEQLYPHMWYFYCISLKLNHQCVLLKLEQARWPNSHYNPCEENLKKRVTFLLYPIKIGTGFFMKWQLSKLSTQMLFSNFVQNDMLAVDTYKANQNFGPTIFYLSIVSKHPKSSWVFTNQKILRKMNEKRI